MQEIEPLPAWPQAFEVREGVKRLVGFLVGLFCGLMLLSGAILLVSDGGDQSTRVTQYLIAAIFSAFFAAFCAVALVARRRIPGKGVTIDREGIWYTRRGKARSLLAWSDVQWLRERSFWQRIDLLDSQGKRRISLDLTLDDLGRLRRIVAVRMELLGRGDRLPVEYRFSRGMDFFLLLVLAGGLAVACVVVGRSPTLDSLGILILPAFAFLLYAMHPKRLLIDRDRIEVGYLLKSYGYDLSQIVDVQLHSRSAGLRTTAILFIAVKDALLPIRVVSMEGGVLPIYETLYRVSGKKEPEPSPGHWPFGSEAAEDAEGRECGRGDWRA